MADAATEVHLVDGTLRLGGEVWVEVDDRWVRGTAVGFPDVDGVECVAAQLAGAGPGTGGVVVVRWYYAHLTEGGAKESVRGRLVARIESHEQAVATAKEAYRRAGFVPEREEPAYLEGLGHG